MLPPLILFLGLTVATAVIAYWSDNLGKKLGKKRVTLFGLRPRTTATILTISSSWAIMLFTLIVLLAVVTPLRNALFRYASERDEYNRNISAAQSQLLGTRDRLAQARDSLLQSSENLQKANSAVEKAQQATRKAISGAKAAQAGEKSAQAGVKTAQDRAKAAQSRASVAQIRAASAQKRENTAQKGEAKAEKLKNQAMRALKLSSSALQRVKIDFNQTQNRLSITSAQLGSVEKRLAKAEASFVRASDAAMRTGGAALRLGQTSLELGKQTDSLRAQRDALQTQIADLEKTAQIYGQAAVQLAGGEVRITVGKTFAARIIAARETPSAIETQLRQILAQGEEDFEQSPETETLYDEGARLILFPRPESGTDNTPILRDLAQIIAARSAATGGTATSVRLVAAFNFTAEEKQIAVRFVAVPVAVAFAPGEVLASATVASSGGDALIFRSLNELIEAGRARAIQRNVNPPLSLNLNEQNFYAEGTNVALFDALRRIEESGQTQRVRLVAAEELSTVEPLRVRFEVENASEAIGRGQ